jgi:hypothetical protein
MKNKTVTIVALSALALGLNACMDMKNAMDTPESKYEKTSSSTDANGTQTTRQTSSEVGTDAQGHKHSVVKSKVTKDPKGLMNKTTTSQSREEEPRN